jgi:hypothetical protein
MELRHEEKLFGNKLSVRQVLYFVGGAATVGATFAAAYGLNHLIPRPGVLHSAVWILAAAIALVPLCGALLLAFVPALGVWKLPGPRLPVEDDGVTPMVRLDEWWRLVRAHRARTPVLPYRRTRALAGEGFRFGDPTASGEAGTE